MLKPGDVVTEKDKEQRMTVESVLRGEVVCTWVDGLQNKRATFYYHNLRIAK